jgi:diguanylate cyclase (GGDEF)-like protein
MSPTQTTDGTNAMIELIHPEDRQRVQKKIMTSSLKRRAWQDQFRVIHPDNGELWVEGHATVETLHSGGLNWYGYLWDISERKHQEDQIRQLALFDPLTGLANRRLLKDRLYHATITSHRHNTFSGLLMLDLDNFKILNDTKGHNTGDALLVEVASRITNCVRETDTVARLGGDEFVVIFEWIGEETEVARKTLMELAEKIRISLSQPYILGSQKHAHHASASIGATLFRGKTHSDGELLKRADLAMFEAKELGRNRVCLYRKERQALISSKTAIIDELQFGLKNNEFSLVFQPQYFGDGSISGAEALLRWTPQSKKSISPATFIPIAEESGLIVPIGEWVLDAACRHIRELASLPLSPSFAIAVNISGHQFSDDAFLDKVTTTLRHHAIDLQRLRFELTESSLVQDIGRAQQILETLGAMGLHCELDDFGTGYSSLTSLKNLPLTTLKIDKSLVHGIGLDSRDEAILRATIAMAQALEMTVIAEGVETKEQDEFLSREGCDICQGFFHSRPLEFGDFFTLMKSQLLPEQVLKAKRQVRNRQHPTRQVTTPQHSASMIVQELKNVGSA